MKNNICRLLEKNNMEEKEFAEKLENANDFTSALNELIKQTLNNHKRIIFNGDGYSAEWIKEAK